MVRRLAASVSLAALIRRPPNDAVQIRKRPALQAAGRRLIKICAVLRLNCSQQRDGVFNAPVALKSCLANLIASTHIAADDRLRDAEGEPVFRTPFRPPLHALLGLDHVNLIDAGRMAKLLFGFGGNLGCLDNLDGVRHHRQERPREVSASCWPR